MFGSVDESHRWCIFCEADCWPTPDFQTHAVYCPVSTGLWPVLESDYNMDMCCGMCSEKFEMYECYMQFDIETNQVCLQGSILEIICIGCAAAVTILGVKYE